MRIADFKRQYPHYSDMTDQELGDALHAAHYSHVPKEQFDHVFHAPSFDYTSGDEPFSQKRLDFEIGLMKNGATSKHAVMIPPSAKLTATEVSRLAKKEGVRAIAEKGAYYLFDPKQIKETDLRSQIKSGKEGIALGYGTPNVPDDGTDYAVDLDGQGHLDPYKIKELRDNDQLGFAGRAPDVDTAIAKIREMGRNDATISGLGENNAQESDDPAEHGKDDEKPAQAADQGQADAKGQQAQKVKFLASKNAPVIQPAVKVGDSILTGSPGQNHDQILESNGVEPGTTQLERGFMTPKGFLTRGDAYEWLRVNMPDAYAKLAQDGVSELHSSDVKEVTSGH